MFDFTRWERIKIHWLYFWKGVFEEYEIDCARFVPILKSNRDGTIYYLMFSKDAKDFSFIIMKELVSEEGVVLTNLDSSLEFDTAFSLLFSRLLPDRKEEIEQLANTSLPFYSIEYIKRRWNAICEGLERKGVRYGVVEQTYRESQIAASTFLINSSICNGLFFMGTHAPENEVEVLRNVKQQAITAAGIARKQLRSVLGIGIINGSDTTIIAIDDEKKGVVTISFFHTEVYKVEEVPRMTVEKLGDLLEDIYDLHMIRFRLYS